MPLVRVPATTANLGPGFDTLGMALELFDELLIEQATTPQIIISGEGEASIPRGPENIAYRAARAVFTRAGVPPVPLKLEMHNSIPVARGLGSSAAALVGAIVGTNALLGEPLRPAELVNLATSLEGHPDNVAPAILGGLVVSAREGDQVICRRLDLPAGLMTVVAIPQFSLSTRVSRGVLPASITLEDAVFNISRVALLLAAVAGGDLELMGKMMVDRLHQPYRLPLVPGMAGVFTAAREAGALAVTLSGSGPSVIAFCRGSQPEVGPAMAAAFARQGVKCIVKELAPCNHGAVII
ncbi:homoserine kinase [Moorella sp. Hama-1]|uniref:homoserine kinase n=1 Tax=Moorella sp. Hama-1 TaxID=2138101 RepID=UPI000D649251|nr:homoserine kinase [Moorella sp. Hama-1]MDN5361536.1 homoserine kinase [Moorella sp. (in: firmicutes)]BCV21466.1 homoserine kinase [Moorella sp. Hama-1]